MVKPTQNIPTTLSDAGAWKQWHISLKSALGRKSAAAIFVTGWNKRGDKSIITHDLNEYLEKYGIILDKNLLGTITEAGADVFDNIGDFMKVGKYLVFGIAGVAFLGVAFIVYNIAKDPIRAAGAAAKLTPAGRTVALTQ